MKIESFFVFWGSTSAWCQGEGP